MMTNLEKLKLGLHDNKIEKVGVLALSDSINHLHKLDLIQLDLSSNYSTLSYDESIRGWVSFFTFKPSFIFSLKGETYSTIDYSMYKHYVNTKDNNYGVFYEVSNPSSIKLIVNSNPSTKTCSLPSTIINPRLIFEL